VGIPHRAILRAVEDDGSAPIDPPVAGTGSIVGLHERVRGPAKRQAVKREMAHGSRGPADHFDEVLEPYDFEPCFARIHPRRRNEPEARRLAIEKPLFGRIEFLDDVFDEAVVGRERSLGDDGPALVLPTTLEPGGNAPFRWCGRVRRGCESRPTAPPTPRGRPCRASE